ncbi:MAG: hypothetical protein ACT6QS_10795 [Flavobacteriales bacterium]
MKFKFFFALVSSEKSYSFKFEAESSQELERLRESFYDIFSLFIDTRNTLPLTECCYTFTALLKQNIREFITNNKEICPAIQQLLNFFNRLNYGQKFLLIPDNEISDFLQEAALTYIDALENGKDLDEAFMKEVFPLQQIFRHYTIKMFGRNKAYIGYRKTCRFCGQVESVNTTFKNKAHAISEALGNKNVVLLEECDSCNEQFSRNIEPDIVEYLGFFRTNYGIKGKGGEKEFRGENFKMYKTDKPVIQIPTDDPSYKSYVETSEHSLSLLCNPITPQNIYKCLCKYFVSTVSSTQLPLFSKTIDWINGNTTEEQLPLIKECYVPFINTYPTITTYIRIDDTSNLPQAVGVFHFTHVLFVFIVPFVGDDNTDFLIPENYNSFWSFFNEILDKENTLNWFTYDYSPWTRHNFRIEIKSIDGQKYQFRRIIG